ncbi:MAG: aldehyde dehydrogenase [Pseudomonadota bacterium]
MNQNVNLGAATPVFKEEYDAALVALDAAKHTWARTPVAERIALLGEVKDALLAVSEGWAETAARKKLIPAGSPLVGEEWISGPYALMGACNGLMETLSHMDGKAFLDGLPTRTLPSGNTAVRVTPNSIWEHLLLSGVKAEVWMQPGVSAETLKDNAASAYDIPPGDRVGKLALVLGAGNIASIAPLDVFQKLFIENQVVLLKMNPVNDYLTDYLNAALKPLIDCDALRIVKGDGVGGAWLTDHPLVEELHITGAGTTHDAIVWGVGEEGAKNKAAGKPKNKRPITSELGAVCPTIVVPGPWSEADLQFQAEQLATQKLHNSGFNCVACQVLIMPSGWDKSAGLMKNLEAVIRKSTRLPYYPGTQARLDAFNDGVSDADAWDRGDAPAFLVNSVDDADHLTRSEVFAPALSTKEIMAVDAESYLIEAIRYANEELYGTLGANIVIHPATIQQMGRKRFEEILHDLRYGCIAINGWSGIGFLQTTTPWGAFPGHTLADVQSGIGTVHNTYMLENTERTVVEAPFRPFPRGVLSGSLSMLPRPPWFITNKRQHHIGKLLTRFQHSPSFFKLPRIFLHALLG